MVTNDKAKAILVVVRQIPKGKVATYGQIARIAGYPKNSRQVGTLLNSLPAGSDVPWFRVVNSQGKISSRNNESSECFQVELLQKEKIKFDDRNRIDLKHFGWKM